MLFVNMIEIISRQSWRAKNPNWNHPATQKIDNVVTMCFAKDFKRTRLECIKFLRWMQHYSTHHLSFDDIRYNFMIGEDGTVYEGRGWAEVPLLPESLRGMEGTSLLLGIIGPFKAGRLPQQVQEATSELIRYGRKYDYFKQSFRRRFIEKNKEKDIDLPVLEDPSSFL